ncbi:MAG: FHA domain-containing protein [Pseudomonadota bacterium]
MKKKVTNFYQELRRRKVFHVGSLYLVTAWGASLGAAELFPAFELPDWSVRTFVILMALGFPVAVVLAWIYELTEQGIHKDAPLDPVSSSTTQLAPEAARLTATWQNAEGHQDAAFRDSFVLGRDSECDIQLDDPLVSRHHARVFFEGGIWQIEDLGSRNGTRVDGQLVTRRALPDRCEVLLHPQGTLVSLSILR